jgi:hypothetical protein
MGHTDNWTKDNYYIQQTREQEIAEAKATHAAKQVEQHFKRDSKPEGRQKEMNHGDMFKVLLFFLCLSRLQDSLEPNLPSSQSNPEDVIRRKVERWLQHN